jgi:hypothetical protein
MKIKKKPKDFFKKEFQLAIGFLLTIAIIKTLPSLLSFNRQGELYEEYYEHALPIGLAEVLLVFFVIRFVVVSSIYWYRHVRVS